MGKEAQSNSLKPPNHGDLSVTNFSNSQCFSRSTLYWNCFLLKRGKLPDFMVLEGHLRASSDCRNLEAIKKGKNILILMKS